MGKEHAVIIMNHSYEIDWLLGWIMIERSGLLGVSPTSKSLWSLQWFYDWLNVGS